MTQPNSTILIYQNDEGTIKVDVRMENETAWLSQQQMVTLFQTSKQNISHHISSIYKEGELIQEVTVKHYLTVQREGACNRLIKKILQVLRKRILVSLKII
jgi:hypothetical protein